MDSGIYDHVTTFLFLKLFSSLCSLLDYFKVGKFRGLFRSRGSGFIYGDMGKLLEKGRIIRENGEVILCVFMGIVLPGRNAIPAHLRIILKAAI